MQRIIWICIFILCATMLFAQADGFGVGVIAGEPTGLSLKYWLGRESALDSVLAWAFSTPASFHIHADYLYHFLEVLADPLQNLHFYAGIGGKLKFGTAGPVIGLRIPLGMILFLEKFPIDIFMEIVPGIDLFPETKFAANFGFGVRYFFKFAKETKAE